MNLFGRRRIYMDYASATPLSYRARRAMHEAESLVGNPSSIHKEGVEASRALDLAREGIARELGAKSREIIFTSGITEGNNLAILGRFKKLSLGGLHPKQGHWIVSSIEHSSVLACFNHIEEIGGVVTRINPDEKGIISPECVKEALRPETVFVSVGVANNEIGVVQPISAIAQIIRAYEKEHGTEIIFHSDAGQALLYKSLQVHTLGLDALVLGASKIYGPHGVGALYASNRLELLPIIMGGGQERGLRSGTENVALAVGFAEAILQSAQSREKESKRIQKLRDRLAEGLVANISGIVVNGDLKHALPHMLNISIPKISSEYFLLALDKEGVSVSTKSACNEGDKGSHVIAHLEEARASASSTLPLLSRSENTLRFSLGRETHASEIAQVIKVCTETAQKIVRH